ncbi:alanine racemase [Halodesulfovibrio spirochaetisodalis]|uniref:Alanine racemase n=1 Tax=Halodesulfovibrio spirochaetisodalis TaxID=1560234 RepID=A0A1B7XDZ8_9BACT|nr:alanine racemase [Halodesulfovibrio spirochaetisodalis]OBQ52380.1 alanine racemase [Halodesulfovibrio spirochaetisodalis]
MLHSEPLWAEIDLSAIRHNIREIRRVVGSQKSMLVVVKGNAYGHGAIQVANAVVREGVEYLGVARLSEAIVLRNAGIKAPILILGYTPPDCAPRLVDLKLTQTVHSCEYADRLASFLHCANAKLTVHIKIDTGMGRLGLLPDCSPGQSSIVDRIESINRHGVFELEGICTHFAASDAECLENAYKQLALFTQTIDSLKAAGYEFPLIHAANSAAIMTMPESHFNMVRPGIVTYGLYPSDVVDRNIFDLKPAMTVKASLVSVKEAPCGTTVSYGHTHVCDNDTRIGVVPIGYADGYDRLLSSKGIMLVHGKRVPVVGRVCMDQTMIDLGEVAGADCGDEVVILGTQGESSITADETARMLGTINYEIVARLMARVRRVYV